MVAKNRERECNFSLLCLLVKEKKGKRKRRETRDLTRKHYHGHKLYIYTSYIPLPRIIYSYARETKETFRSTERKNQNRSPFFSLHSSFLPFFLPPIFSKSSPLPSLPIHPVIPTCSIKKNDRKREKREEAEKERGSCTAMHRHPISFTNRFQTVFIRRRRRAAADREGARAREGGWLRRSSSARESIDAYTHYT